jgi:hypothetical protein
MSVKIEILDYVYEPFEGGQIVPDYSFNDATAWVTGTGWSIASGKATHIGSTYGYLQNNNVSFEEHQTYRIKYEISGRTSGNLVLANHLAGGANGFSQNANGAFTYDWVQGDVNNDKLSLYGSNTFDGSVEYAAVYPISNINWEKSILGELDVTDNSNFPLALTFQISDIQEITSTSGDYSKTFKIPATKNNNALLKNIYTPNIQNDKSPTQNMKCRITLGGMDSLSGLLKVTGVGGYGETPSYYNCVFYGNNLSWANLIDSQYMNDIDWYTHGDGLVYQKAEIMATWADEHCDSSTSPLVYPVTSYGVYNFSLEDSMIQLLDTWYAHNGTSSPSQAATPSACLGYSGFTDTGSSYGNPQPSPDWRPSIFVKTTLENIFKKVGYSINSTFMNTDMFKKLVWLLPNFKYNNPDERVELYSIGTNFVNGLSQSVTVYELSGGTSSTFTDTQNVIFNGGTQTNWAGGFFTENLGTEYLSGASRLLLPISASNLNISLGSSHVDLANDWIVIGEYGYYNLSLDGIQARLASGRKGGTVNRYLNEIKICVNLEVQTVGHTSWNIIGVAEDNQFPTQTTSSDSWTDNDQSVVTDWGDLNSIELEGYYLNKNDKIRLTVGLQIIDSNVSSQNYMMNTMHRCKDNNFFNISIAADKVEYGQTYNLSDVINKDYKQIDFIKGIAHAFNLNITTDEAEKQINIEPFDNFYLPYGSAIDWTYKLDRSKDIEDRFLESDLKRKFIFKYKTDSQDSSVQYRGVEYFKDVIDEYPYQEELANNFEKGVTTFENPFFAGTFNAKDQDTFGFPIYNDTAFSACLWEERENNAVTWAYQKSRPEKGFNFTPRLLYWNKYSPTTGDANLNTPKIASIQTWSVGSMEKFVLANADAPTNTSSPPSPNIISNAYPQATSINRDDSTSPILSYGNVFVRDYDDAANTYTSYTGGKGLYEAYYKKMFEMFKQSPRVRTVNIDLKTSDIVNLDFRKLVYIDGFYWRLNKIIDFMPNKNESTKVELIEWFEVGTFAATAPSFGTGLGNMGNSPIGGGINNDQPFGGSG